VAGRDQRAQEALQAELYEQIGRLKMELEWLKKKAAPSVDVKRTLIEPEHPVLSVRRQCELIGLNRSSGITHSLASRRRICTSCV